MIRVLTEVWNSNAKLKKVTPIQIVIFLNHSKHNKFMRKFLLDFQALMLRI